MQGPLPNLIDGPAPVRRAELVYLGCAVISAGCLVAFATLVIAANLSVTFPNRGPRWSIVMLSLVLQLIGLVVAIIGRTRRLNAIAAAARENRGLMCRACMYPMLESQAVCPECGLAQDVDGSAAAWLAFADRRLGSVPMPPPRTEDGVSRLLRSDAHWGD